MFLHGGSYVFGPVVGQWEHFASLCARTGYAGLVIDYRKAKTAPYPAAVNDAKTVLKTIYEEGWLKVGRWALIGDSAGGGLSAVVCRQMIDENGPVPICMVLMSPWVNMVHTHPDIPKIEAKDPFISLRSINRSAALYASGTPLDNPNLSPVNAELKGMPPMLIIAGGIDALVPDMRIYVDKLLKAGVDVEYLEEPEGVHVYPGFIKDPLAEKANAMIIGYLTERLSKMNH